MLYDVNSLLLIEDRPYPISVPPTKIELSGILSGTRLEVKENEEVELTCVVHDAKPKATIVWYKQNTEFYTGTLVFQSVSTKAAAAAGSRTRERTSIDYRFRRRA